MQLTAFKVWGVVGVDMDGDGKPDMVIANYTYGEYYFSSYLNTNKGNTVPTFNNGTTQVFSICENASADTITSLLYVSDTERGRPKHGPYRRHRVMAERLPVFPLPIQQVPAVPASRQVMQVTYTPATGFSGTETFAILLSDGAGGTDTTTFTVTVNPLPVVPAITGAAFVCVGSNTTLSDTATGGSWSSTDASIATVNSAGMVTGIGAGADTIQYSKTNGCGTATSS